MVVVGGSGGGGGGGGIKIDDGRGVACVLGDGTTAPITGGAGSTAVGGGGGAGGGGKLGNNGKLPSGRLRLDDGMDGDVGGGGVSTSTMVDNAGSAGGRGIAPPVRVAVFTAILYASTVSWCCLII